MVEFVSANPTGPLHVGPRPAGGARRCDRQPARVAGLRGHARVLLQRRRPADRESRGRRCARAPRRSSASPAAFPEDGYHGEYIREIAQRYLDEVGHDLSDIEAIRKFAVAELRKEQDRDLLAFGVKFDNYYLESSLYTDGRVEGDRAAPRCIGQDVRARRRAVAAHHRLRRRQGPRDAQVRRRVHVLRARRRVSRDEVGARLSAR